MTLDTNAPPRKENNAVVGTRSRRATRSRSSYLCFQTPCSPLKRGGGGGRPAEERMDLEAADDKTSLLA
jgi:hypothetical protein